MRKRLRPGDRASCRSILFFLVACSPLAADPAPREPQLRHSPSPSQKSQDPAGDAPVSPSSPAPPTEEEREEATALSCPGEAFRILVLPGGSAFLQNLEVDETDSQAFVRLPLRDPLNPPRSSLACSGAEFRLKTSPPFSNRFIEQQFAIENGSVRFVLRRESDPAEHMIEEAFQLALRGRREALRSVDFSTIDYLHHYVDAVRFERYLETALRQCDKAPCQPILENTFYLIARLASSAAGADVDAERPTSWVQALEETGVSMASASPALLRYVEILRRHGNLEGAASLLVAMIQRADDLADLHLVYGDLLWEMRNTTAARREYRLFADLVVKEGRPVPVRIARLLEDR